MHIHTAKAGMVKRRGHFNVAVHALLAQNCHSGFYATGNIGCGDILIQIKAELCRNTRILSIQNQIKLLLCTARVISQCLHLVTGFCPGPLQINATVFEDGIDIIVNGDLVRLTHAADDMCAIAKTGGAQIIHNEFNIG